MTQQFQTKVNKILDSKVQIMLYTKYRDNEKAAEAAFDTWEIMMKDFQYAVQMIEDMHNTILALDNKYRILLEANGIDVPNVEEQTTAVESIANEYSGT